MGSVRVAIVGVGNCASSLVQGVEYYKDADPNTSVPGLMHVMFGDYHVKDVEFVAAFDVDAKKVGFDLSEAIVASENNTIKIADVPPTGVIVQRGVTNDGLGKYYRLTIEESEAEPVDIVQALKDAKVDVLVSYMPVGSEVADKYYAQCAIDANVAFVNALPVFIASDPVWAKKFEDAGVPVIGDDIKSQVGATITHRVMAKLFEDRGVVLGPHLPAERRRQHGLQEHARARPSGVQEDLQDPVRHVQPEARPGRAQRPHRPQRLHPVAGRPQVGLRTPRGSRLRQRAAEPVVQAGGLGLPELGRHHHRLHPRGQDRQGPRHRRRPDLRFVLPDEVPAGSASR